MLVKKMLEVGRNNSVNRDIAEYGRRRCLEVGAENVFDFSIGNPNVPAPQVVADTLIGLLKNTSAEDLHAYTAAPGDVEIRQAVAEYVQKTFGFAARGEYIYMTSGASSSLVISLNAVAQAGDEVILFTPYFPEYCAFIEKTGAKVVAVNSAEKTFQLDKATFAAAINKNTKAVIVNSPSNPTGVVLTHESIEDLATVLREKSAEFSHPI